MNSCHRFVGRWSNTIFLVVDRVDQTGKIFWQTAVTAELLTSPVFSKLGHYWPTTNSVILILIVSACRPSLFQLFYSSSLLTQVFSNKCCLFRHVHLFSIILLIFLVIFVAGQPNTPFFCHREWNFWDSSYLICTDRIRVVSYSWCYYSRGDCCWWQLRKEGKR